MAELMFFISIQKAGAVAPAFCYLLVQLLTAAYTAKPYAATVLKMLFKIYTGFKLKLCRLLHRPGLCKKQPFNGYVAAAFNA